MLEAGKPAEIRIDFASKEHAMLGIAAFRMGIGMPMGDAELAEAIRLAGEADVALVFAGRNGEWDTEGSDLENIALPGRQDELISAVASVNPNTVVVLQTGGPVEMPWLDSVAGVMQSWYAGQETGNAIADVLLGAQEPGGRLAQSFPAKWSDNPAFSQDPLVYPGIDGNVEYREGLFIGYRHYEQHGIKPLFPFGFGLSYTRFTFGPMRLETAVLTEGKLKVSVLVRNIGDRTGSTVVQLYIAPDNAPVSRPKKELKAFAKVALEVGEARQVDLNIDARAFAYFDVTTSAWIAAPGTYRVMLGTDAESIVTTETVTLPVRLILQP
jgi:beta-glucosidase